VPAQPKVQLTTGRKALLQTKAKRYSKVAEAIVLGVKDNERHKQKGAEIIKWKAQISQKLCGQIESCKITMSQGRGRLDRRSIGTGR